MKARQEVFKNNKKVNENIFEDEKAKTELINLLILALKKQYKVKFKFDHIRREARASFHFLHELSNGQTDFFRYDYLFYNISNNIDL